MALLYDMKLKNYLQLLVNTFTSLTPSNTQKSYCHIRSPWLKYYTCQFYKLKMRVLLVLHQDLCQGAAIAGCCQKRRQMGTTGDKRARGGRTLLSKRQDAEQTVWVRVWPRGTHQGQFQSHDHQAREQGECRPEVKLGSQDNTEYSEAVLLHICHTLLKTKTLKNILSIIFRIILVYIMFMISK